MRFTDLLPHAPQVGLYVSPQIPESKLSNALDDYAGSVHSEDVLALFDATLMGSAKDGAVFTRDRMVFQNNDLQPPQEVRYEDIVQVDSKRKILGGRRVLLTVNRGRATFEIEMDFSGKPKAADFVLRFLREAMLHPGAFGEASDAENLSGGSKDASRILKSVPAVSGHSKEDAVTDRETVLRTLDDLLSSGRLSPADYDAMIKVLDRSVE